MELIVKIGADQQGLRDTIERIKTQFKNMNTSMPSAWAGNQAGMSRYGSILQTASSSSSALSGVPVIGALAEKFTGLLGPIGLVGTALGGMATAVHQLGSAISNAAADMRTGRITGMSGLMARRWRQAGNAAGVDEGAGMGMVNKLNANVGAFNAGDSAAQTLFDELGINPSGMSTDDLLVAIKGKIGAMQDPAQRARLSKGLFGRGGFEVTEVLSKLKVPGLADTEGGDMAAASGIKKWWKSLNRRLSETVEEVFTKAAGALGKSRLAHVLGIKPGEELKSGVAGQEFADILATALEGETPEERDKRHKAWAAGKTVIKAMKPSNERDNGVAFNADQLAQAGLFAGSSLLMNPNLTIQVQQLEVLRRIEGNTSRGGIFA